MTIYRNKKRQSRYLFSKNFQGFQFIYVDKDIDKLMAFIVKVEGEGDVDPYTSKETPMIIYLNTHAALEQMRLKVPT